MNNYATIIVCAGNFREFERYIRNIDPAAKHIFTFASSVDKIRGLRAAGVVVYGTFNDKDNAQEIYNEALQRTLKDINLNYLL